jgi:hypothetical protein
VSNWLLIDPAWSPELYELIAGAYHNLRRVYPERARERGEPEPFEQKVIELEWSGDDCCINIADECDPYVRPFPINLGGVTVILSICEACRAKAGMAATTGLVFRAIAGQATLPPGARIDPGSPLPPRP